MFYTVKSFILWVSQWGKKTIWPVNKLFWPCFHATKIWILKNLCQRPAEAIIKNLTNFDLAAYLLTYTAIFLTNGLCIVYFSLPQCLTLVYLGWGQKYELFCLLVTTCRLWGGMVVGYRSTTVVLRQPTVSTRQPMQGPLKNGTPG